MSIEGKINDVLDKLSHTVIDGDMNYNEMWAILMARCDNRTLEGIYTAFKKELQRRAED